MDFSSVEKVTLANGLRILMLKDERCRSASVSLWIGSGSRLEQPQTAGVSHFIEHMLFKGTGNRSAREIAEEMDYIGGQFNAYTTKEYTCVYARALSTQLDRALDIISDMVVNSLFSEGDIETERGVILEEIGMYEDSPEDLLMDGLYMSIWQGSALGANILGTRESVSAMTAADMRAHMSEQYGAQRLVLAVSGAFDRDRFVELASEKLGVLSASNVPFETEKAIYTPSVKLIEKEFEQTHICMGFPGVSTMDEDRHALSMLNAILGGSTSSRMFQRVREELGLAYSVGSSFTPYMKEGVFEIDAAVSPKNDLAALGEMTRELCRIKRDGVTEVELDRAREQTKAGVIMGLEGNAAAAAHMGRGELFKHSVRTEDEIIATINSVTVEQVNRAARRFIDFDSLSLCAVGKVRGENSYIGVVNDSII